MNTAGYTVFRTVPARVGSSDGRLPRPFDCSVRANRFEGLLARSELVVPPCGRLWNASENCPRCPLVRRVRRQRDDCDLRVPVQRAKEPSTMANTLHGPLRLALEDIDYLVRLMNGLSSI